MLKWFAKYNKILLVTFGVALMVSFTVGTVALDNFFDRMMNFVRFGSTSSPGEPIGTMQSGLITTGDEREAYFDQQVLTVLLGSLNPLLPQILIGDDQLRWSIVLQESRDAGLWASDQEVMNLLAFLGVTDTTAMAVLIERSGVPEARVYEAVRHYLMVDKYRRLVSGAAHMPLSKEMTSSTHQRLVNLREGANLVQLAQQVMRQGQNQMGFFQASQMMQQAQAYFLIANGAPRASSQALEHLVADQASEISGDFVLIGSQQYLDKIAEPDEAALQKLFDEYRDDLPGRGEPYPFGYKFPERVKIETVSILIGPIRETVRPDAEVDIAAAMAFYRENETLAENMTFEEARPQIINQLIDQRAQTQAMQLAKQMRAMLMENLVDVSRSQGYYDLPESFEPVSMRIVADELAQQSGVAVLPGDASKAAEWSAIVDLVQLPYVGMSVMSATPQVTFIQYLRSARELEPETGNPLIGRRLQVGVPSEIMQGPDGSLSVFRLVAASSEHEPADLDVVRDQVLADARQVAAFEMLKQEQSAWLQRGQAEGLDALAESLESQVISFPALSRMGARVPGLGRSEQFTEAAFELADELDKPGSLADLPVEKRIGSAALDRELSLAVFELTDFAPVSRRRFLAQLAQPEGVALANLMIESQLPDPMALDTTLKRADFVYEEGREPGVDDDPDFAPTN